MGFWEQPEEVQVDLLAYHRIARDRTSQARYGLLAPWTFDDAVSLELLKKGKLKMTPGLQHTPHRTLMPQGLVRKRMEKSGANPKALDFWLGED